MGDYMIDDNMDFIDADKPEYVVLCQDLVQNKMRGFAS